MLLLCLLGLRHEAIDVVLCLFRLGPLLGGLCCQKPRLVELELQRLGLGIRTLRLLLCPSQFLDLLPEIIRLFPRAAFLLLELGLPVLHLLR